MRPQAAQLPLSQTLPPQRSQGASKASMRPYGARLLLRLTPAARTFDRTASSKITPTEESVHISVPAGSPLYFFRLLRTDRGMLQFRAGRRALLSCTRQRRDIVALRD